MNKWALMYLSLVCCLQLTLQSCQDDEPQAPPPRRMAKVPKFHADSAYSYISKQVDFGPRVPGTPAHEACKAWLTKKLDSFGAEVIQQEFTAKVYTGATLPGTNIIGQYNKDYPERIILAAHWDTRHIADKDPDSLRQQQPIPGADDGASGVGVLLEIARQLHQHPLELGIDIIFFDLEDYGKPKTETSEDIRSWILGSQHWAKNPHRSGYRAKYGLLLDMVGSAKAQFTKEKLSREYAPQLLAKIWQLARRMNKQQYFLDINSSEITDDHSALNVIAEIPTVVIVNHPVDTYFGTYHHTHADNMDIIDKNTLAAVGQVVLAVVYNENNGVF